MQDRLEPVRLVADGVDSDTGNTQTNTENIYGLTWRIRMMAGLLVLSLAMTLGLVLWSAESQDDIAVSQSRHLARSALNVTLGNVSKILTDYTWWDDAYFNLSGVFDSDWYDENFADSEYLYDTFGIASSFAIGPDNRIIRHMHESEIADSHVGIPITSHIEGGIGKLADRARTPVEGEFAAAGGIVRMGGQLYLAAVRVVHPHNEDLLANLSITPENAVLAAFMRPLDDGFLEAAAEDFGLRGLQYVAVGEQAQEGGPIIPLVAPNGDSMGHLVWRADRPSRFVLGVILPSFLVVVGIIGLLGWYTLRRMQQQQLALWNNMSRAVSADRTKTEFLANMSHELRTPLNAIIGFSETMRNEIYGPLDNKKYAEYTANILESGQHLLNIITDVLEMSKVEAGKYQLNKTEILFRDMGDSVARMIGPRLDSKNLAFDIHIAPELHSIHADEQALKQVLLNILSNAVKFTPDGGLITLHAELLADAQVRLSVSDTGIGIPEDQLPLVMRPFHQIGSPMTRLQGGTGLGLPLAAAMVKLHGGRIEIRSKVGEGTTVTITLPAERADLVEAA